MTTDYVYIYSDVSVSEAIDDDANSGKKLRLFIIFTLLMRINILRGSFFKRTDKCAKTQKIKDIMRKK